MVRVKPCYTIPDASELGKRDSEKTDAFHNEQQKLCESDENVAYKADLTKHAGLSVIQLFAQLHSHRPVDGTGEHDLFPMCLPFSTPTSSHLAFAPLLVHRTCSFSAQPWATSGWRSRLHWLWSMPMSFHVPACCPVTRHRPCRPFWIHFVRLLVRRLSIFVGDLSCQTRKTIWSLNALWQQVPRTS